MCDYVFSVCYNGNVPNIHITVHYRYASEIMHITILVNFQCALIHSYTLLMLICFCLLIKHITGGNVVMCMKIHNSLLFKNEIYLK